MWSNLTSGLSITLIVVYFLREGRLSLFVQALQGKIGINGGHVSGLSASGTGNTNPNTTSSGTGNTNPNAVTVSLPGTTTNAVAV